MRTAFLVVGFVLLLCGSILLLSFLHGASASNEGMFLMPDATVAPPTAQELLQKKFEVYNTVTEEDGKSVVTIFSEEQIADIRTRRENGEWFWLSSEEMLYLINDTVKLFEEYDVVYIRDLDGNLNKYYGMSFFSSEEYYASFGGFDLGVTDASFDLKKDVYETILKRCALLNSLFYTETCFFTDISKKPTDEEIAILKNGENPWFWNESIGGASQKRTQEYYVWRGYRERIAMQKVDSSINSLGATNLAGSVFSEATLPGCFGGDKYDTQGKTAVIEVYEEKSQLLIARLRYTEEENVTIIQRFQKALTTVEQNDGSSDTATQATAYRVVIYLNGFNAQTYGPNPSLRYCPDGNIDWFAFTDGSDVFQNNYLPLRGGAPLTALINELLYQEKIF